MEEKTEINETHIIVENYIFDDVTARFFIHFHCIDQFAFGEPFYFFWKIGKGDQSLRINDDNNNGSVLFFNR